MKAEGQTVIFFILLCFVSEGRAAGREFSDKSFHIFEKSRTSQLTRCRADLFLASCDRKRRRYRHYFTDGNMHTAQHSDSWHVTKSSPTRLWGAITCRRHPADKRATVSQKQFETTKLPLMPSPAHSHEQILFSSVSETRTDRHDGVFGGFQ